ncbi:hypothetical protein BC938DRAFT_478992 [Jimgerdemannia flammicorona]|uniref:Uncharacterized protein n=1 Tax=Jimgerdemannia flammicorona TaxID=994334 RepID=A0A433QYD5_9FUNG|nr:hypothetical protein BC938DRAFT_478992 [Jimgerdemannia flammicorona]
MYSHPVLADFPRRAAFVNEEPTSTTAEEGEPEIDFENLNERRNYTFPPITPNSDPAMADLRNAVPRWAEDLNTSNEGAAGNKNNANQPSGNAFRTQLDGERAVVAVVDGDEDVTAQLCDWIVYEDGSDVKDRADKAIMDEVGKAIRDRAGKVIRYGAGKAIRNGASKDIRDGAGKDIRNGAGKVIGDGAGKDIGDGAGKGIMDIIDGAGKDIMDGAGKDIMDGSGKGISVESFFARVDKDLWYQVKIQNGNLSSWMIKAGKVRWQHPSTCNIKTSFKR